MIYISIECRVYNWLDECKTWLGNSTMASPCRANHGLGHLLGNSRTCGDCQLPSVCLLQFGGSLMNGSEWVTLLGCLGGCIYTLGET
jgi:hypothetical protein